MCRRRRPAADCARNTRPLFREPCPDCGGEVRLDGRFGQCLECGRDWFPRGIGWISIVEWIHEDDHAR